MWGGIDRTVLTQDRDSGALVITICLATIARDTLGNTRHILRKRTGTKS